jgi:hypothetical protein
VTRGTLPRAPVPPVDRHWRVRWLLAVALVGGLVFTVGLLVEARCAVGRCPAPTVRRLFDLDAVGALPRMFTTAVFVAIVAVAVLSARRSAGHPRLWWAVVAVIGVGLVVAKAVSVHSSLERDDGGSATLVIGVGIAVVGLSVLWWAGRWWSVAGTLPVVAALAAYAFAALALDQVTRAAGALTSDPLLRAVAVYLEEGGEAVTALMVLAAVVQALPRRR